MRQYLKLFLVLCLVSISYSSFSINSTFEEKISDQLEYTKLSVEFYNDMYDKWDLLCFQNIGHCNKKHFKILESIIDDHCNSDMLPSLSQNVNLKSQYKDLTAGGNTSLIHALNKAAHLEEKDVKNLMDLMEVCKDEEVSEKLYGLLTSSRCYLKSIVGHLDNRGVEYRPVVLSVHEYMDCLNYNKDKPTCPYEKSTCPYADVMDPEL